MPRNEPSDATAPVCRLCLVAPDEIAADFADRLDNALAGGDVACLFLDPATSPNDAAQLVAIAQRRGVAAIVIGDAAAARKTRADGVLVESGLPGLKAAVGAGHPDLMVGGGNISGRDRAMRAGELEPDYLFFGRRDGDTDAGIFPKALNLAAWWSELFEIPAVVMGGMDLASVTAAAEAGIEFVCLRRAVWEHAAGPAEAVRRANGYLAEARAGAMT